MEPVVIPKLETETVTEAIGTAVSDTIGLFGEVLPYALAVFAAVWGVRKAKQFFTRMA